MRTAVVSHRYASWSGVASIAVATALLAAACGGGTNDPTTGAFASPTTGESESESAEAVTTAAAPSQDPTAVPEESTAISEETVSADPPPAPTRPPVRDVVVPENLSVKLTKIVDVMSPLAIATRSGSDLLYTATKEGKVLGIEVGESDGAVRDEVIDVADLILLGDERGLLGMAFSPDGDRLYLNYTNFDGDTVIAEYLMDGAVADASSQRIVLTIDQPGEYHNGGHLAFGPDGYLYIGMGDGNSDASANAQDTSNLLGDVLRIDPLNGDPYAIPPDNPFVERGGAPEVFISGVRNPWKFSFDRATGDLWITDVGLSTFEEIDVLYASQGGGVGVNLGWPLVEGSLPFLGSAPASNYVAPIHEYGRDVGCSITGGVVYRGSAIPELYGSFIFSDFCSAKLLGFASSESQGPLGSFALGVGYDYGVAAVGEGPDGELYVASFTHEISRIDPA